MNQGRRPIEEAAEGVLVVLSLWALTLIAFMLAGCSRKVYVPVESVRTECRDRVQMQTRVDSILQRDSVAVYVNGDTVRITQWRDRVKYRDREVHDTILSVRRDSVAVPYPVERELTRWEKTKMDFGGMAIGGAALLAVGLAVAVVWLIRKERR